MTEPRCIPLEAISDEAVGGKAEGLVRLLAYGFDVPSGFVVVGASPGRLPNDLDEQYARIGAGKVAVRSSAAERHLDDEVRDHVASESSGDP